MKSIPLVAFLLLSSIAITQDTNAVTAAKAACGQPEDTFSAKEIQPQPDAPSLNTSSPTAGKAQVYIIEAQDKIGFCIGCDVTAKVGLDGSWIGATRGNSFLSVVVDPGEHHLCTTWQSLRSDLSRKTALNGFAAEAGKTYFFRIRVTLETEHTPASFLLDPVNSDEGRLLLASSATIRWKKK